MNWKRIWTGSLLAGFVFLLAESLVNNVILTSTWEEYQRNGYLNPMTPGILILTVLGQFLFGFLLTWLYALARPRLGPGPKTALIMGTIGWFLLFVPQAFDQWAWYKLPLKVPFVFLVGGLVECWVAIYLAGWQYIEKAPD